MKETINVSVNGIRFIITSDAYNVLRAYLNKVEATYSKEVGGKEIISDIEARVAELLLSWQNDSRKIITKECVEDIVQRLGEPDGVVVEEPQEQDVKPQFERRLYRSKEGATLGGVLSGMACYFNVDVTVFRIFYVLFFFIGCFSGGSLVAMLIVAYIVMWIIVPKAVTARQKMEMKGQPVTAASIENSIKNEINSVYKNPKNTKIASVFSSLIYFIVILIKGVLLFVGSIIGITILIILITIISISIYMLTDIHFVEMFVEANPYITITIATIAIMAPLMLLVYSVLRLLFKVKWNKFVVGILVFLWIFSWLASAVLSIKEISRFKESYTDVQAKEVVSSASALYINVSDDVSLPKTNILTDKYNINYSYKIDTFLSDNVYRIEVTKTSNGRSFIDARQKVLQIEDPVSVESDTSIIVSPVIRFVDDDKVFNNQQISVCIYYPKNGRVVVSEDLLSSQSFFNE